MDLDLLNGKIYVFISHSHKDIDKVRYIRNYLEDNGIEPILFFLKSKTDKDEIEELIKAEIKARIWFIYCESKNSRESNWVKTELEYIKELKRDNNLVINLDKAFDGDKLKDSYKKLINLEINALKLANSIYCIYSHKDVLVVSKIIEYLKKENINVIDTLNNLNDSINNYIKDNLFELIFVTNNSIQSNFYLKEIEEIIKNNKKYIIINLDNIKLDFDDNIFDFDINNIEESSYNLMNYIYSFYKKEFDK